MSQHRRLSRSRELIQPHYDVLVIGSGYGAAVAASRFARSRRADGTRPTVAVFERGREWLPGDFPGDPIAAEQEFQIDAPRGRHGKLTALYDLRVNEDEYVFVGCGLGGTSLVNANVALEADPRLFADPVWPAPLRDPAGWEPYYERARQMLRPRSYPESLPTPRKLSVLAAMASAVDGACIRPPINVNFEFDGPNHVGVPQVPCDGCGDCVSGCNSGAKNTLAMNYLPDAAAFGAEIFCEVQVRRIARDEAAGCWHVYYQMPDSGQEAFHAPDQCVRADVVVIGAGSLGSTEILLRSKAHGLPLSDQVGTGFTGNGDVLAFGYNLDQPVNGIGRRGPQADPADPVGPCITGLIDRRGVPDVNDGYVIEEGSLPSALALALPGGFAVSAASFGETRADGWLGKLTRWWRGRSLSPYHGAVRNTQTYLVMSHDGSDGRLELRDDRLRTVWPGVADRPVFERINEALRKATFSMSGVLVTNPLWSRLFGRGQLVAWLERALAGGRPGRNLITVHPLGGCGIGAHGGAGVVNADGQVFRGGDTAVYDSLYVVDGAIMPRSLGVNPLLTITAMAERIVERAAALRNWQTDLQAHTPPPAGGTPSGAPEKVGLRFTETMRGYFSTQVTQADPAGFAQGWAAGQSHGSPLSFTLTVETDDLDTLLDNPGHPAGLSGTVHAPALSPEPLTVSDGHFALFVDDQGTVETRNMRYRMKLTREDGRTFWFRGDKVIHDDPGMDTWADTTTLYVALHDGDDEAAPVLGVGILHIEPADFIRQMGTLAVPGARHLTERLAAVTRFGRFFAGTLLDQYGGVFTHYPLGATAPVARPVPKRPLRVGTPEVYPFTTADGVALRLTRYRGGDKGPVLLSHGLGVASTIFSLDTIDTNLLEFLYQQGYDVWLLDYRASILLPACRTLFTGDAIARYDYPAAVNAVRTATGKAQIDVVAHCFGASTLFMALAAGLEGVRSAVFSQVAGHMVTPLATRLKAGLHLPDVLDALGIESLTAHVAASPDPLDRLYDLALSKNLAIPGDEHCDSAACHRISFMYALLYEHAQLNQATHDALGELFGESNIQAFEHLARTVRAGKAVAADGADVYLPEGDQATLRQRLARFDMPIRFIHGAENACFLPESTERTRALLAELFGEDRYSLTVIPGYGHIDCIFGRDAARDVYPYIVEHLERMQG